MFYIVQEVGWPIWPLLVCSVVALALVIERFVFLKTARVMPPRLLDEVIQVSRQQLPGPEVVNKLAQNSLFGEVLASGFRQLHQHPRSSESDVRSALEGAGRLAAAKMQKYLGALGTIASAAPLLGLLGTVIGMIEIFGSQGGPGGLTAGGGDPAQLARGISIALYNTAFGLLVAIPALVCWRHLRARAETHLLQLEIAAERFAQQLCAGRDRAQCPPSR